MNIYILSILYLLKLKNKDHVHVHKSSPISEYYNMIKYQDNVYDTAVDLPDAIVFGCNFSIF